MDRNIRRAWFDTAADILATPHPAQAMDYLTTGLAETFHVFMGARVSWRNATAQLPSVTEAPSVIEEARSFSRDPHWDLAVQHVAPHHPLTRFHMDPHHLEPSLLSEVTHRGQTMTQTARDLFEEYHLGRHHLSLPVVTQNYTTSYGLVSEVPFSQRNIDDAREIQRLIVGLESHLRLLHEMRPAADSAHDAELRLTTRETLILEMIAQGKTATGIAARLAISPRTVHKHQEHLYRKLGAQDRLSAVLRAQSMGLLELPDPPTARQ
ncbi:DNA-binding CsgD family transcriptional regulator [Neomicrococcus aestuarii]|uniref:DNA-binding CsgD family transcriptional regulator n=1 Tax=Neomicrococcus aestuarii TaxID=556325 RepID=A0A7W8TSB9_9MICC|nr:LuxR C-terminal-related transcriptional regulator [Neomicrococcus aestuarii]MBB5512037.1 DNA-binding CsgD family transcriptional regulator [Neomicrococcus aestuarii]